jgi:hypothetical protein
VIPPDPALEYFAVALDAGDGTFTLTPIAPDGGR